MVFPILLRWHLYIESRPRKLYWWLSARLWKLQCVSNGVTIVLCWAINIISSNIQPVTAFLALQSPYQLRHAMKIPLQTSRHYTSHTTKLFSKSVNFWQIFEFFSALTLKKKSTVLDGFFPYLAQMITSTYVVWEDVLHIMTFDLDLYLQGNLALALKIVSLILKILSAL